MEIKTVELEKLIQDYFEYIGILDTVFRLEHLITIEAANEALETFEQKESPAMAGFLRAQNEIRKNLITIADPDIIDNYQMYIMRSFSGLWEKLSQNIKSEALSNDELSELREHDLEEPPYPLIYIKKLALDRCQWALDECISLSGDLGHECHEWLKIQERMKKPTTDSDKKNLSENHVRIADLASPSPFSKLKWVAKPADLAFVFNLLQSKGYVEGLIHSGEGNARLLLTHFEVIGGKGKTTSQSLGKCFQALDRDELPISKEDAAKFQVIPRRKDLKR